MQHRNLRFLSVSAALVSACLLSDGVSWAQKSASGVTSALEKKYVVTQLTSDYEQITKDGTTMSMKCPGVYTVPTTMTMVKPDNNVVDGKVQTPGTMKRYAMVKMGAHVLQSGDKVYITKLESKSEMTGDVLKFTLLTVEALDVSGSEAKKKFDGTVSFKFKKGYLDETPPEQVEQVVESVLAPDAGDQGGGGGEQQQAAAAPAAAPARAAAAAPAAAPAAAATPPPTISIGESSTEVLQAMGMPLQMIDLGKKKTYVYKGMKIIFMNDKVTDVQ